MLAAGTKLGPYEVLAPLGAGGMGEVYRARDARLGRDVAIKVLPPALSSDPDRLRRFEQEARAAGMLNHPNILAVYDIGTHEGAPYLVSELLEGETLRDRLKSGALSLRKTIDHGLQMSRGLAAAHEKGITHRDLKPDNVFVTKDGRVKIFDFGLAKLTRPEAEFKEGSNAPTLGDQTQPGAILGTVGYMSPEQVRGQPVDHRSDIFTLGAILYEMISGRRAFQRGSSVETMNAILNAEPPELTAADNVIPPALERLVHHCLEKSPEERFQSARDIAFDLETLSAITGATTTVMAPLAAPEGPAAAAPAPVPKWRRMLMQALVILAVLAGGFIVGQRFGTAPPPSYQLLTFRRGSILSARFAPDGQTIVYGASWDGNPVEVLTTRPESLESRSIGQPATEILSISPSGEMAISLGRHGAGPFLYSGTLARASIVGGASREILEDVQQADWGPDGANLAVVRGVAGRNRLEYPVGKTLYETAGWIGHARVSPKGDLVAFIDHPVVGDDGGEIAAVDLAGKKKTLSSGWISAMGLAWSPGGSEIWFTATRSGSGRGIHAVSLSGKERLVTRIGGTLTLHDISREGRVLLTRDSQRQGIIAAAGGENERDLSWLDFSGVRDISPDGKTILFSETGEGGGSTYGLYIRKTDGSPAVRIGEAGAMGLSPDGKWALGIARRRGGAQMVLFPTGPGEPKPLPRDALNYQSARWFPDGKRFFITGHEPGHATRLYVKDLNGGQPRPFTPEGTTGHLSPPSPDGRFVLARNPGGKSFLYPVENGEPVPIPAFSSGDQTAGWSADGRSIYVYRRGELPTKVYQLDLATGRKVLWKQFMPADPAGVDALSPIIVAPDGKSYTYTYNRMLSDLYLVEGLK